MHTGDSVYRASYIPLTPDPLLMTVSWNGRQLKGCPLQINVTSAADASRVICSGDGLKHGIVGQEIRSFIDTRRAGPGKNLFHAWISIYCFRLFFIGDLSHRRVNGTLRRTT